MAIRPELAALATEMAALESETFEIKDYVGAEGTALLGSTSTTSCSTSSSTTSCTSSCG